VSKVKCVLTLSSVVDTTGYQLQTHEVDSLEKLHEYLLQSGQRSKVQKLTLIGAKDAMLSISLVVESLVVKS
jgi:hypothetical protein